MLARIRKSAEEKDQGFTLIELLVVMIIIGILAAIAIPVFLNQRKKAQDSAAKADVSTIGKEIATYYVDGTGVPVVSAAANRWVLTPPAGAAVDLGKASNNVVLSGQNIVNGSNWCVSVTNAQGDKAVTGYRYSASGGLEEVSVAGAC